VRVVEPAVEVVIEPGDSPERIVDKAVAVRPRRAQLEWQHLEVLAFTHYGMNTFTNREWGTGWESPQTFAPAAVDAAQWMEAYAAMGAPLAILTVKHHDGFVLFPTRYTRHCITSSPWSGDVLREYVDAARAAGLKVGVYLSPADGAELAHDWFGAHRETLAALTTRHGDGAEVAASLPSGHGRYGNGSVPQRRTIPTLVPGDDRAERLAAGELPSFEVDVDDYNAYFLNQLYEVLTEYGPFDEIWFDGANPWANVGLDQRYDMVTWWDVAAALAPEAVVFGGPGGVRWIGNESGIARESEWSVVPITDRRQMRHAAEGSDLGSREALAAPDVTSLHWLPGEADVSIRRGWFHHPEQAPKTAAELLDLYEQSVGRNATLLLNVPPAVDGRIEERDVAELRGFRAMVDAVYGHNLAAPAALDDDLVLRLDEPVTFDRVRLGEDVQHGQRVEAFVLEASVGDGRPWDEIVSGTTIGMSRIVVLSAPVTARAVRVRVVSSRGEPRLAGLSLHSST
jgi:alpha-L-fucosidase